MVDAVTGVVVISTGLSYVSLKTGEIWAHGSYWKESDLTPLEPGTTIDLTTAARNA